VTFGDSVGAVYGFAVADLDGDGYLDIAAARSEAPNMLYFGDDGRPARGRSGQVLRRVSSRKSF
jgi:FG-GAP repeat protein